MKYELSLTDGTNKVTLEVHMSAAATSFVDAPTHVALREITEAVVRALPEKFFDQFCNKPGQSALQQGK